MKVFAFRIAAALSAALLCVSCASMKPLAEMKNVADAAWELRVADASQTAPVNPEALSPGKKYDVIVLYRLESDLDNADPDKKWRELWKYDGVYATVDDAYYSVFGHSLTVSADPFRPLKGSAANLKVTIPGSAGSTTSRKLGIVYETGLPSFRGSDGSKGSTTQNGTNGTDGRSLMLEVAHYDVTGTPYASQGPLTLVYDKMSRQVWLLSAKGRILTINAAGGNGGSGENGEDRYVEEGQDRVVGGDGTSGGHGGRGGIVTVAVPAGSSLANEIFTDVRGGSGGRGGMGGKGDQAEPTKGILGFLGAVVGVNDGADGRDGQPGQDGRAQISPASLDTMFLEITAPDFDRSRLRP